MPGANNRALEGLPVEIVEADLRDAEACRRAVAGCARVYHVAAKISILNPTANEHRELFAINVLGTKNIVRAALAEDVARVVMTGSFSAVGYDPDKPSSPSTEDMPFYPFEEAMPYAHTKAAAEHELLKAVIDGLDAVVATSCSCIGPHDYLPSRIGRTMCDFVKGKFRAYIDGEFEFVRAADLADGHVRAMEQGRRGHKYVFATEHRSLEEMIHVWSDVTGIPPVRLKLPAGLMAGITGLLGLAREAVPQRAAAAHARRDPHPAAAPARRHVEGQDRARLEAHEHAPGVRGGVRVLRARGHAAARQARCRAGRSELKTGAHQLGGGLASGGSTSGDGVALRAAGWASGMPTF
jgi:nucleoside-diphosphate-sugar epimerase